MTWPIFETDELEIIFPVKAIDLKVLPRREKIAQTVKISKLLQVNVELHFYPKKKHLFSNFKIHSYANCGRASPNRANEVTHCIQHISFELQVFVPSVLHLTNSGKRCTDEMKEVKNKPTTTKNKTR
jgi:hypothetical protein